MENFEVYKKIVEEEILFNKFMGLKVHSFEQGVVRLLMPFREEFLGDTRRGAIHGGVISMLIDTCGGFAVWSMCEPDARIATIDMRVDYLKPALAGNLIAESKVKLLGNRVGNAHTEIYTEGKPHRILAEGRSVYNVRRNGG